MSIQIKCNDIIIVNIIIRGGSSSQIFTILHNIIIVKIELIFFICKKLSDTDRNIDWMNIT